MRTWALLSVGYLLATAPAQIARTAIPQEGHTAPSR